MRTFLAVLFIAVAPPALGAPPANAAALFERMKSLEGSWTAKSTKGWDETVAIQVIAGGSAVLVSSRGAHPGETMLTVYTLDGDRVLLTHYCVAGNQPRLRATAYDAGSGTARFEFLDGTGMRDREVGHMDQVDFRFDSLDHYFSRWTWYAKGSERWMEGIEYTRAR